MGLSAVLSTKISLADSPAFDILLVCMDYQAWLVVVNCFGVAKIISQISPELNFPHLTGGIGDIKEIVHA